jgi:hypothetical protein
LFSQYGAEHVGRAPSQVAVDVHFLGEHHLVRRVEGTRANHHAVDYSALQFLWREEGNCAVAQQNVFTAIGQHS